MTTHVREKSMTWQLCRPTDTSGHYPVSPLVTTFIHASSTLGTTICPLYHYNEVAERSLFSTARFSESTCATGEPEAFDAQIYKNNAAPKKWAARFVRTSTIEMRVGMSQEPCTPEIQRANTGRWSRVASVSSELAQSKCTWTCHKRNFMRKFKGGTLLAGPSFCASPRNPNAHGHVTTAFQIWRGNFWEDAKR